MGLLEALKLKADPADPDSTAPPSVTVKEAKDSATYEAKPDGAVFTVKREVIKKPLFKKTFAVGPIPCLTKGDFTVAIQGQVSRKGDTGGLKLQVTVAGALALGPGAAEGPFTLGFPATVTLSSAQGVSVTYSEAAGVVAEAFVCNVVGSGKVGFEVSMDNGPRIEVATKLFEAKLLVVRVLGYANGKFVGVTAEPGADLLAAIATLEAMGSRIAKAVDDANDALESGVRDIVDPGGETGRETSRRQARLTDERNESTGQFVPAMTKLDVDLASFCTREERQAIHDAYQEDNDRVLRGESRTDEWKTQYALLLNVALQRKSQAALEKVQREAKATADTAEDLIRRVKASESRLAQTLVRVNELGNPLKNGTSSLPRAQALKKWTTGMKHHDQAVPLLKQIAALKGEARIRAADDATRLLLKACSEFK